MISFWFEKNLYIYIYNLYLFVHVDVSIENVRKTIISQTHKDLSEVNEGK